jgi:hypothetical protein
MSDSTPPPSAPSTPNKFRKLKHVPQGTPETKSVQGTVINLEYNKNPSSGELTDNMRLTVVLKAGTKNPKGLVASAWNGANLREKWWFVREFARCAFVCVPLSLSLCASRAHAGMAPM